MGGSLIHAGKKNVLGIWVDAVDREAAVELIAEAARCRRPLSVTALAVHGLMMGVLDKEQRYRLNSFDLVLADGQPVRWALNWLHKAGIGERVYGPDLTLALCERAEREGLPVYLYGSTREVLSRLRETLSRRFPRLVFAGMASSKFGRLTAEQREEVRTRIRESGASIVFAGLGCPRQEVWAYEFRGLLDVPIIAVGAAFPLLGGTLRQAPRWMQDRGLEWLFRFSREPLRLWSRYLLLNPMYLFLLLLQALGVLRFRNGGRPPTKELLFG